MKNRAVVALFVAFVFTVSALAQQSNTPASNDQSAPAAQSSSSTTSTDSASGKAPLQYETRQGFWGKVNPFARKKYVQRQLTPIQNRVNETRALEQKARTDAEGVHNQVVLGARTAFVTAQTQAAQVKALEAAEASSKLALDATQLGYKVGVKVNLDVLNAQSQLYSTQKDAAGARYNYLMSQLKLRQAAGNLTTNDLLPIDALLVK